MQITVCFEAVKNCLSYYFLGKKIRICVTGVPRSGKTTFCKAFVGQPVLRKERPTRGVRVWKFAKNDMHGTLYDIGGAQEYVNLAEHNYRNADALVFVLNATESASFADARERLAGLLCRNKKTKIPILILCTHNDVEGFETCQRIALELGLDSLMTRDVSCYSVSSITLSNFDAVAVWVARYAK